MGKTLAIKLIYVKFLLRKRNFSEKCGLLYMCSFKFHGVCVKFKENYV